jgi:hypothetical protein
MRLNDWAARLSLTIQAARGKDYVFGEHDCALMAADCALALTGTDPLDWARGRYSTYVEGIRLLKHERRVKSLEAWADTLWTRVPHPMAQRGDWAFAHVRVDAKGNERPALLVFDRTVIVGPQGVELPRAKAKIAWRVE